MMNPTSENPSAKPAVLKAMDLLAIRPHSQLELRQKLELKGFPSDDIEEAISHVTQKGWLKPAEELAEEYAQSLKRKNKSIFQINLALEAKGLPPIKEDTDSELEIALRLLENKSFVTDDLDYEETQKIKAKVARQLETRGFSSEVIEKVLHEKFPN